MATESPSLLERSGCQWAAKTLVWTQKGDSVDIQPLFIRSTTKRVSDCLRLSERPHLPSSAERVSDLSFTNSLATSSPERWERMRMTVRPVSSMCIRGPSGHQQAQLALGATSRNCMTAIPTTRSARPKQQSFTQTCSS